MHLFHVLVQIALLFKPLRAKDSTMPARNVYWTLQIWGFDMLLRVAIKNLLIVTCKIAQLTSVERNDGMAKWKTTIHLNYFVASKSIKILKVNNKVLKCQDFSIAHTVAIQAHVGGHDRNKFGYIASMTHPVVGISCEGIEC